MCWNPWKSLRNGKSFQHLKKVRENLQTFHHAWWFFHLFLPHAIIEKCASRYVTIFAYYSLIATNREMLKNRVIRDGGRKIILTLHNKIIKLRAYIFVSIFLSHKKLDENISDLSLISRVIKAAMRLWAFRSDNNEGKTRVKKWGAWIPATPSCNTHPCAFFLLSSSNWITFNEKFTKHFTSMREKASEWQIKSFYQETARSWFHTFMFGAFYHSTNETFYENFFAGGCS